MAVKDEVGLGDEVKDSITGLIGVVVAITNWLNGCQRLLVQPRALHDGKPVETQAFDVEQMEIVKRAAPVTKAPTGGFYPSPSRAKDPR